MKQIRAGTKNIDRDVHVLFAAMILARKIFYYHGADGATRGLRISSVVLAFLGGECSKKEQKVSWNLGLKIEKCLSPKLLKLGK